MPVRATAATCIPSPNENERESKFIPTLWAANWSVPSFAAVIAVTKNPILAAIFSIKIFEPSPKISLNIKFEKVSLYFFISPKDMYDDLLNNEEKLITAATKAPKTVAIAAPFTPNFGKPKFPFISK